MEENLALPKRKIISLTNDEKLKYVKTYVGLEKIVMHPSLVELLMTCYVSDSLVWILHFYAKS